MLSQISEGANYSDYGNKTLFYVKMSNNIAITSTTRKTKEFCVHY